METEENIKSILAYGESWDFPKMPIAWKKAVTIQRSGAYDRASEWIPGGRGGWVQFIHGQSPEKIKEIAGILQALPLNDYDDW